MEKQKGYSTIHHPSLATQTFHIGNVYYLMNDIDNWFIIKGFKMQVDEHGVQIKSKN